MILGAGGAVALPGPTACLAVGIAGLQPLGDRIYSDTDSTEAHQGYQSLVDAARDRITATFGAPESRPIMVFLQAPEGFGPFKLNAFGSTQMIGSRACVMIGPSGQNVDVVAHELMHAEIHHRAGAVARFLEIPTWFDEGVAMQVDYRSRYTLESRAEHDPSEVRALNTAASFFSTNDKDLTQNYASAKAVVAGWTGRIGANALYERLRRLQAGEPFSVVIPEHEWTTPPR